ncbi:MAG: DUF1579 family protein [Phycisphaerales bacterium]|nr:DUF1579 family protein [Phycisphaerales bacterium]
MRIPGRIVGFGTLCIAGAAALGQRVPDAQPRAESPAIGVGIARFARGGLDTTGPSNMHEYLAQRIGEWTGTLRARPSPGSPAVERECTMTVSSMLDGRFIRVEVSGEIPGVGPFVGIGVHGFDNASRRLEASWIDSLHAGVLAGTGEADGATLAWTFAYRSPLTKRAATLRLVERRTGKDAMTVEWFEGDPADGRERRTIEMTLTREPMQGPAGRCAVVPITVAAPKERATLPD